MKPFYPGKKVQVPCETCKALRSATFDYGTLETGGVTVQDALRATCDVCGSVVAGAPEAVPKVRRAIHDHLNRTSMRISQSLVTLAQDRLGKYAADVSPSQAALLLVKSYLGTLHGHPGREREAVRLMKGLTSDVLDEGQDTILTIRAHPEFFRALQVLSDKAGLSSPSEAFRRVAVLAVADPEVPPELEKLATIYA